MMTRKELDLWVGIFAVVGIGAMLFLSLKVANLASFSSADSYQINAKFETSAGSRSARRSRAPAWWWAGWATSVSTTKVSRPWYR